MIGAPPAQDEQARMSGARGDFVASLPRRLEVLRAALRAVEDQPRDPGRINGLLRRLHALGSAARVLGFASVAEALGEAEKTLRRVARSGPAPTDLADIGRALDLLPSLVLGAKVSIRAALPAEPEAAPTPEFPLSVLVCGPEPLAKTLAQLADLRIEHTEDPGKARELSRVFGPDAAVIDADRKGARELVELFVRDPLVEPIPIVVIGDFASPELTATFIGLGAARVLPKPVSPDLLRRTLLELRERASPPVHVREPFGELNVSQLVDRIAIEIRRGLVEAVEPSSRAATVGFGEGTDVMGAVWGTVARLRELVTLRSDGSVRFEQGTGPEGAVPFAPWNDHRRAGERGGKAGHAGEDVSLQGRRVMIADDDPAVVWFLAGILKTVGAEVYEAHDGERAFELTTSLWPDLVVSDVLMPKLDGFSLCHEIKRDVAVRDVPVILLSWKEDLLQRVRELGGDADGYLRKEAAASTVVERLREVLRPRSRVEQRVASGGEVRGRLDGLTPRLVLELACRAQRDVRVSIRDSSYLYEVQVRSGEPRTAIRSANDGSFERGEHVLSMLLGVSAGRFVIEPDVSPCRAELSGSLHEQLAAPVARARAAQRALSAGALASVTRVAFDTARVGGYLECTPEPAQSLLRELLTGASPRDLLTSGRAPARLLEAVLSDFARRGAILLIETAGGIEDISQTRVPPAAQPNLAALPIPEASPEPPREPEPAPITAPLPPQPEAPPVSQRRPPAIYSHPPEAELESADAGWFSFQIESSVQPPAVAPEPAPEPVKLARSEDPLRKTLSSSAPPAVENEDAPGASVPVERGVRPEPRTETLGSAGNEAAAAIAAVSAEAHSEARQEPAEILERTPEPVRSPPRPAAKPPRPTSPQAPAVTEDDPLAQALLVDTPPPVEAKPVEAKPVEEPVEPASPPPGLGQTLPLNAVTAVTAPEKTEEPKSTDVSTQPPSLVAPRAASPRAPVKAAPAPKPEPPPEAGGWLRTAVYALIAAGVSYFAVIAATKALGGPVPAPSAAEVPELPPVPVAVVSTTPAVAAAPKLKVTTSESPLPPGSDVPAGNGMLEIQVPEGTAIRVDGEYLGMGPARRVPLAPGEHSLALGDAEPQSVTVKLGQRTLAVAGGAATPASSGSP
jgi:DNA-binding response OmpR family regulator/HPt (histidine-containing phosphotransfer) domain-containing protein